MVRHDWSVEDYDEYCKEKVRISQQRRREKARKNGICTICCLRPARANKITCAACSIRIADRAREKRMQYTANGLCPYCGKNAPEQGKVVCTECSEKKKQERKAHG